jgi:hypothetical protein
VKKTKEVAWISSNCGVPSKRDEYVKELSKYIPVDISGKCGTHSCSKPRVWCKRTIVKNLASSFGDLKFAAEIYVLLGKCSLILGAPLTTGI